MKVLGIVGSPRLGGNTEILVERALSAVSRDYPEAEAQILRLAEKKLAHCRGCAECRTDKMCAQKDDFQSIYPQMLAADAIVIGSPTYYGSATSLVMALLHRAGHVAGANGKAFAGKIGGPIAVARRAGHNFTYSQLLFWYMINDMVVPGSTYWNVGLAREKGDILQDEEALRTIDHFGKNIARMLKEKALLARLASESTAL